MGRQSRVGGPPPQGPVPVLAGLMDGNGCSIGTHILSYKPGSHGCPFQVIKYILTVCIWGQAYGWDAKN